MSIKLILISLLAVPRQYTGASERSNTYPQPPGAQLAASKTTRKGPMCINVKHANTPLTCVTPAEGPKKIMENTKRTYPSSQNKGHQNPIQCTHYLRNDCLSSAKQSLSEESALRSVGIALSKYGSSNAKEVLTEVMRPLSPQKRTPLLRW